MFLPTTVQKDTNTDTMAKNNPYRDMVRNFDKLSPEERIKGILNAGEAGEPTFLGPMMQKTKLKSFEQVSEKIAKATYTFTVEVTRFQMIDHGIL